MDNLITVAICILRSILIFIEVFLIFIPSKFNFSPSRLSLEKLPRRMFYNIFCVSYSKEIIKKVLIYAAGHIKKFCQTKKNAEFCHRKN